MQSNTVTVGLLLSTLVAAVIGALDAGVSDEPDLIAVFVFVAVVQAVLLIRLAAGRHPVLVRADLWSWVHDRAIRTGDRPEQVADRAIAAYRTRLEPARTGRAELAEVTEPAEAAEVAE
jgi:hypothetical protein